MNSSSHQRAALSPNVSATCQLHLSTGLVLAPLGDARYYACDELKRLSIESLQRESQ